jgi:hypothetical protein
VAASDLPLVLEAIGHLDLELERLTHQASDLVAPSSIGDRASTAIGFRKAIERSNRALCALRERVLDSTSRLTLPRFESALRARTSVLQVQLHELTLAEADSATRLWPCGRFGSLVDVSAHVLDRLGRVNAMWLEARRSLGADEDGADHRRLIAAVAQAERDLIAIGRDIDLISFLAAGASVAPVRFRLACRVIAALFEVPLGPLTPRVARGPSLARHLAPHVTTFTAAAPSEEDDQ